MITDTPTDNFYTVKDITDWVSICLPTWLNKSEAKKLASWWNNHDKKHYYFVRPIKVLLPFRKVIRYDVIKTLIN